MSNKRANFNHNVITICMQKEYLISLSKYSFCLSNNFGVFAGYLIVKIMIDNNLLKKKGDTHV